MAHELRVRTIYAASVADDLWALCVPVARTTTTLEDERGAAYCWLRLDAAHAAILSPLYVHDVCARRLPDSPHPLYERVEWRGVDYGFFRDVALFPQSATPTHAERDHVDLALCNFLARHTAFHLSLPAPHAPTHTRPLSNLVAGAPAFAVPVFPDTDLMATSATMLMVMMTPLVAVPRIVSDVAPCWESALILGAATPRAFTVHPLATWHAASVGAHFALRGSAEAAVLHTMPDAVLVTAHAVLALPPWSAGEVAMPRGDGGFDPVAAAYRAWEAPPGHPRLILPTRKAPSPRALAFYCATMEAQRVTALTDAPPLARDAILRAAITHAGTWLLPILAACFVTLSVEFRRRFRVVAGQFLLDWKHIERRILFNPHTSPDAGARTLYAQHTRAVRNSLAPFAGAGGVPEDPRHMRSVAFSLYADGAHDAVAPRDVLRKAWARAGSSARMVRIPLLRALETPWADVLDMPGIRGHALPLLLKHPYSTLLLFPEAYGASLPDLPSPARALNLPWHAAMMSAGALIALAEAPADGVRTALAERARHVVIVALEAWSTAALAQAVGALQILRRVIANCDSASSSMLMIGAPALAGPFAADAHFLRPLGGTGEVPGPVYEPALRHYLDRVAPEIPELGARAARDTGLVQGLRRFLLGAHDAGWWRSVNRRLPLRDLLASTVGRPYTRVVRVLPQMHALSAEEMARLAASDPVPPTPFIYATQMPVAYTSARERTLVLLDEGAHLHLMARDEVYALLHSMARMRETQRLIFLNAGGVLSIQALLRHVQTRATRPTFFACEADVRAAMMPEEEEGEEGEDMVVDGEEVEEEGDGMDT